MDETRGDAADESEKNKHFDEEVGVADSVKLSTQARNSNAGGSNLASNQ